MSKGLLIILAASFLSFFALKTKKHFPPGTLQITETFFADETEISNLSWLEYEYWTARKYGALSAEHLAVMPDSNVWTESTHNDSHYGNIYYRGAKYRDYPVVGVSYEQCLAFCRWRTEMVKQFYAIRYRKELVIEYRLPTMQEWEIISASSMNATSTTGRDHKGRLLSNHFRRQDTSGIAAKNDMPDITAPVYSFWPNRLGLYNTVGNVAEMVAEKGICKGGSWHHQLEQCRIGKKITYSKPAAWLGFRCVCDVKTPVNQKRFKLF